MFDSKSKNTKNFLKTFSPYIFSSSVSGSQRNVKGPQMRGQIALGQWLKGCIYKGYCNLGHIFSWDLEEFQIYRFIFVVLNCKVRH